MSLCLIVENTAQLFSDEPKRPRKRAVRILIRWLTGRKPKYLWHSSTVSFEPVRMIFINTRVTAKSSECLCRDSTGHTSIPYSIEDIHFTFSKFKTISSETKRPILLYSIKWQIEFLFCIFKCRLHLKFLPLRRYSGTRPDTFRC